MLKIPIFYYHSIGNTGPETLSVWKFKNHLSLIREMGFTPITFAQLIALNPATDKKYVVLTFDDGLLDNYEIATPILTDYGYNATFFVIPGFDKFTRWVNPSTSKWSDFKKEGFTIPFPSMQANHRQELVELGMEIGSHTMTHPALNKINSAAINDEIMSSKALLEDQLGIQVKSFCYPKGRYNRAVLNCVASTGYSGACTTIPGYFQANTPKFECGRFLVEGPGLFRKILQWSSNTHAWTELVCNTMRPALKFKNYYL